jgi:hypothetical protein
MGDKALARQRAAELKWAKEHPPESFSEFAAQSAVIFRDMFGDDFAGVVAGKNDEGQPVSVYIEGTDGGETVEVREMPAGLAGSVAQLSLDTGEPPTIPDEVLDQPPIRLPIADTVRKALG